MPLIIMCGLPSSGKTYRTNQIKNYFESLSKIVHVISDTDFNIDKNECYLSSTNEKELRGSLKSEVQKHVSKDNLLILDSLNYIKGYRYELFCISKLCQTPQCVVFTNCSFEECSELNKLRPGSEQYTDEVMKALEMRFEEPNTNSRWDSPLFTINKNDSLDFDALEMALYQKQAPPPNKSTLNKPLSDTTFLHDIDKITQDIVTHLVDLQKNQLAGEEVLIPNASEKVHLVRPVSLPELRKCRQQFLTYIKMHPPKDTSKIANMFVQYINNMLV